MKKELLFMVGLVYYVLPIAAQDISITRNYLDTLCAPGLYGRGAAFDGQKKAALYLSDRFHEKGLLPLSENFYQSFYYNINTFPGQMSLATNLGVLTAGIDYIVDPSCPSGKGKLKIQLLDTTLFTSEKSKKKFLCSKLKKTALVYDEHFLKVAKTKPPEYLLKISQAGCVVLLKEKKLTMGLSSRQSEQPTFEILREKFNTNAKTLIYEIEASLLKNYQAQNICGMIKGTSVPDSFVFITAHYDHLGTLGKNTYFPGANDNGSGVSMLLNLVDYFYKNPQRYSIVFIAFGAEEAGLIGSKYFTENPLVTLRKIRFLINLDLMGTGEDGMMVVNGTIFPKEFELLNTLNEDKKYLPVVKKRGKAANSDHYFFSEKGVPAFFFYTLGGIAAYHDVIDVPETLPLTKFNAVFHLITEFVPLLISTPR